MDEGEAQGRGRGGAAAAAGCNGAVVGWMARERVMRKRKEWMALGKWRSRDFCMGMHRRVATCVVRKIFTLGRIILLYSVFWVCPGAVKQMLLHVGLEEVFCEEDE